MTLWTHWTIREFNLLVELAKEDGMSARRIAAALQLEGYNRTRHAVGRMAYDHGVELRGKSGCYGNINRRGKFKRTPEETR